MIEEAGEHGTEVLGRLAVEAILVRQTGIRDARHPRAADLGQGAQVVEHLVRTGGAVEAHVEEVAAIPVQQRRGQGFDLLAPEHGPRGLDGHRDRHRQPPTQLLERPLGADQAGLHVARVLAGFEQQVVGAAGREPQGLDAEVVPQLFEGDAAGHRDRLRRRPHRAADEALAAGRGAGLASQLGGTPVELERALLEAVLREHQGRTAERVGLDDVGAGVEVGPVDSEHHVGPGRHQDLVATLELRTAEVLRPQVRRLKSGAGGPVEHQDPLLQGSEQGTFPGCPVRRFR